MPPPATARGGGGDSAHLPGIVLSRLLAGPPATPHRHAFATAALFADIAGFTTLTERLAALGRPGLERLSHHLSSYLALLSRLVAAHGGEVVRYAGDAVLVLWLDDGSPLDERVGRAGRCALEAQLQLHAAALGEGVTLSVKVGVGVGEVAVLHVGTHAQREYVAVGDALQQAFGAEHAATAGGDVVLSQAAWEAGGGGFVSVDALPGGRVRVARDGVGACTHGARRVSAVVVGGAGGRGEEVAVRGGCGDVSEDEAGGEGNALPDAARAALIRSYLCPAVHPWLSPLACGGGTSGGGGGGGGGVDAWCSELRRGVTAVFVNVGLHQHDMHAAARYDDALRRVQGVYVRVEACVRAHGGVVNKLLCDDKGTTLVAVFGLPLRRADAHAGRHPPPPPADHPTAGVLCSLRLCAALWEDGLLASGGVATGAVFAGTLGSATRREYTVLGDAVNTAARLMQRAATAGGGVLVDDEARRGCCHGLRFARVHAVLLKGKAAQVGVARPYPPEFLGGRLPQRDRPGTQPSAMASCAAAQAEAVAAWRTLRPHEVLPPRPAGAGGDGDYAYGGEAPRGVSEASAAAAAAAAASAPAARVGDRALCVTDVHSPAVGPRRGGPQQRDDDGDDEGDGAGTVGPTRGACRSYLQGPPPLTPAERCSVLPRGLLPPSSHTVGIRRLTPVHALEVCVAPHVSTGGGGCGGCGGGGCYSGDGGEEPNATPTPPLRFIVRVIGDPSDDEETRTYGARVAERAAAAAGLPVVEPRDGSLAGLLAAAVQAAHQWGGGHGVACSKEGAGRADEWALHVAGGGAALPADPAVPAAWLWHYLRGVRALGCPQAMPRPGVLRVVLQRAGVHPQQGPASAFAALLRTRLRVAAGGPGSVALVTGCVGSGKTALLHALVREGMPGCTTVLCAVAHCVPQSADEDAAALLGCPWTAVLRQLLASLAAVWRVDVTAAAARVLRRLGARSAASGCLSSPPPSVASVNRMLGVNLPCSGDGGGSVGVGEHAPDDRVGVAVGLLAAACSLAPTTLVLDDAHLLSGDSHALTAAVVAEVATGGALPRLQVVLAAREDGGRTFAGVNIQRLHLPGFTRAGTAAILAATLRWGGHVSAELVSWAHDVSRGNPLLAQEAATALLVAGRLASRDVGGGGGPVTPATPTADAGYRGCLPRARRTSHALPLPTPAAQPASLLVQLLRWLADGEVVRGGDGGGVGPTAATAGRMAAPLPAVPARPPHADAPARQRLPRACQPASSGAAQSSVYCTFHALDVLGLQDGGGVGAQLRPTESARRRSAPALLPHRVGRVAALGAPADLDDDVDAALRTIAAYPAGPVAGLHGTARKTLPLLGCTPLVPTACGLAGGIPTAVLVLAGGPPNVLPPGLLAGAYAAAAEGVVDALPVTQLVVLRVLALAEGGGGGGGGGVGEGGEGRQQHSLPVSASRRRGVSLRALSLCLHPGAASTGTPLGGIDHTACVAALVDAGLVVVVAGALPDPAARVRVACAVTAAALSQRALSEQRHIVQHALLQCGSDDVGAWVGGGGGGGGGGDRGEEEGAYTPGPRWRDSDTEGRDDEGPESEPAVAPETDREPSAALLACMAARRDRAWVRGVGA